MGNRRGDVTASAWKVLLCRRSALIGQSFTVGQVSLQRPGSSARKRANPRMAPASQRAASRASPCSPAPSTSSLCRNVLFPIVRVLVGDEFGRRLGARHHGIAESPTRYRLPPGDAASSSSANRRHRPGTAAARRPGGGLDPAGAAPRLSRRPCSTAHLPAPVPHRSAAWAADPRDSYPASWDETAGENRLTTPVELRRQRLANDTGTPPARRT